MASAETYEAQLVGARITLDDELELVDPRAAGTDGLQLVGSCSRLFTPPC
jgi:hypothetical protein